MTDLDGSATAPGPRAASGEMNELARIEAQLTRVETMLEKLMKALQVRAATVSDQLKAPG
jgi:hypothetical protein